MIPFTSSFVNSLVLLVPRICVSTQTNSFSYVPAEKVYFYGDQPQLFFLPTNLIEFPLAFDLVPAKNMPSVSAFIKSRGMACSVYGAQYLLEALYKDGEADHALSLMTSESRRSWLNMLHVGSTMTTEACDEIFKPNLTWNHAWGSAPANIIARKTMGNGSIGARQYGG